MSSMFAVSGTFSMVFRHVARDFHLSDMEELSWIVKGIGFAYDARPNYRKDVDAAPTGEALSHGISLASCASNGNFGLPTLPGYEVDLLLGDQCFETISTEEKFHKLWLVNGDAKTVSLFSSKDEMDVATLLTRGRLANSLDDLSMPMSDKARLEIETSMRFLSKKEWSFGDSGVPDFVAAAQKTLDFVKDFSPPPLRFFLPRRFHREDLTCKFVKCGSEMSIIETDHGLMLLRHEDVCSRPPPRPFEGMSISLKLDGSSDEFIFAKWSETVLKRDGDFSVKVVKDAL